MANLNTALNDDMASPSARERNPDASKEEDAKTPSARTLRGLDWLNFFLADVQTGIGPFLARKIAVSILSAKIRIISTTCTVFMH
jgi:hypothetical protein